MKPKKHFYIWLEKNICRVTKKRMFKNFEHCMQTLTEEFNFRHTITISVCPTLAGQSCKENKHLLSI